MNNLQDLQADDIRSQRLQELEAFAMAYDADPYPNKRFIFWQTLFLDRGPNKERLLPYKATQKYRLGLPPDEQARNLLVQRVAMNLNERTFFVTTKGYFGIGPPTARENDLVCVVLTAHGPFVFRPISGREYQFVGDSYVYGISDGEILGWAKTNGKVIKEFWIR